MTDPRPHVSQTGPEDRDLLDELTTLLAPEELSPPSEGIASLRRAVAEKWSDPVPGRPKPLVHWPRSRWGRAAGALGVVLGVTIGGSGAAFAAGAVPEPIRAAAHDLGLPVDSPALSAAKHAESRLRAELGTGAGASPAGRSSAAAEAQILAHRMAGLSASDRRKLGAAPYQLLREAGDGQPGSAAPTTTLPPRQTGDVRSAPAPSTSTSITGGARSDRSASDYPGRQRYESGTSRPSEEPSPRGYTSTPTTGSSPTPVPRTRTSAPEPAPAPAPSHPTWSAPGGSVETQSSYPSYPTSPTSPTSPTYPAYPSAEPSTSTTTTVSSSAYPFHR